MMTDGQTIHISADMLDAVDRIAEFLGRDREWVVHRAWRHYLAGEGGNLLRDAEGFAALRPKEVLDRSEND